MRARACVRAYVCACVLERDKQTEIERQRQTERERQRQTERERQRQTERERQRQTEREHLSSLPFNHLSPRTRHPPTHPIPPITPPPRTPRPFPHHPPLSFSVGAYSLFSFFCFCLATKLMQFVKRSKLKSKISQQILNDVLTCF